MLMNTTSKLRCIWSTGILFALSSQLAAAAGPSFTVDPQIDYFFADGPGEGLSVSHDGRQLLVSTPVEGPAGVFNSSVEEVNVDGHGAELFELEALLPLPDGEVTDVSVVPHRDFHLAVVRSDLASPASALLAFRNGAVVQSIPIPANPDGMKVTPDGRLAIVAVEKGGDIRIYDLSRGAGSIQMVARVTREAIAAHFVGVPNPVADAEPEAVGVSSDSSFALVTLQDCSSVVALDLRGLRRHCNSVETPEAVGDTVLQSVVHLPYGYVGSNGQLFGVEPDGVSISPDGRFAIVAHEANQRAKHLAGISILDLRHGLQSIEAHSYSIFDIDPSLLANTGLAAVPLVAPGAPYPTTVNRLPRLDPASVEIVKRKGRLVAAVVVERYDPSSFQIAASAVNEVRGSVLFLDVSAALTSEFGLIDRVPVGAPGSRLEVIDSAREGRLFFVSISNGNALNGSAARLELH